LRDEANGRNRSGAGSMVIVMPALVAGIHVFFIPSSEDVDGRDKPGHDGNTL
jgi:hypothetical protein